MNPVFAQPDQRILFLDYLKAFIIILVVAHHSSLAYMSSASYNYTNYLFSSAPVVDVVRNQWFYYFQAFNDIFFMSLMFFISGIFTFPSLQKKGPWVFLKDRVIRLGIPFLIGVIIIAPVAYYPSYLVTGHQVSFWNYCLGEFFRNGWIPGPAWFLWVLLAFSIVVIPLAQWFSGLLAALHRFSVRQGEGCQAVVVMIFLSLLVCVFASLIRPSPSASGWISLGGPLWIQVNRAGLYFLFFLMGAVIGQRGLSQAKIFGPESFVSRSYVWLLALALGLFILKVRLSGSPEEGWRAWGGQTMRDTVSSGLFAMICVLTSLGLIGFFRRFMNHPSRLMDFFSVNAFLIYLVHYPFVIWIQYFLLPQTAWSSWAKFCIVFAGALLASALTALLARRLPGVQRIF